MQGLIGQTVGNYQIEELIGRGGMGSVYLARHATLNRFAAIKVMQATLSDDETSRLRFLREAKKGAQLDHPNIVKVFDYHEIGDMLFIVMEYVAGDNVRRQLKTMHQQRQWVQLAESVQMVRQLAMALDCAHMSGVIHRDVKPDNVLLKPVTGEKYPYRPMLADLGLVRSDDDGGSITTGGPIGTPGYMSPEHALGQTVTAQSDIYSLGVMLYELAVGHIPLRIPNMAVAYRIHIQRQLPPSAKVLRPDLPIALDRLIDTAMAYEPDARFATAKAMAEALEQVLRLPLPTTPPPGNFTTTVHFSTSRKVKDFNDAGTVVNRTPSEPNEPEAVPLTPARPNQISINEAKFLVVEQRNGDQYWIPLTIGILTVGRGEDNTLVIPDDRISRKHMRIEFDGQRLRLTDLNSRNGIYLDGQKLLPGVPQIWNPQKSLSLGRDFEVSLRSEAPEAPPPFEGEDPAPAPPLPPPPKSKPGNPNRRGNGRIIMIFLLMILISFLLLQQCWIRSAEKKGDVPLPPATVLNLTSIEDSPVKMALNESPTAANQIIYPTETAIATSTQTPVPTATDTSVAITMTTLMADPITSVIGSESLTDTISGESLPSEQRTKLKGAVKLFGIEMSTPTSRPHFVTSTSLPSTSTSTPIDTSTPTPSTTAANNSFDFFNTPTLITSSIGFIESCIGNNDLLGSVQLEEVESIGNDLKFQWRLVPNSSALTHFTDIFTNPTKYNLDIVWMDSTSTPLGQAAFLANSNGISLGRNTTIATENVLQTGHVETGKSLYWTVQLAIINESCPGGYRLESFLAEPKMFSWNPSFDIQKHNNG